jgi:hypothetical protein
MLQVLAILKRLYTNHLQSLGTLCFDQRIAVLKCVNMNLFDGRIHFYMSHILWNSIFRVFVTDEHIGQVANPFSKSAAVMDM